MGGDCRLLLVVGDAGVGKTRFAREGLRQAAAGGMVSVWGVCLPLADKLPLLPLTQALGELNRVEEGRLLDAVLPAARPYVRAEVARLVPELASGEPEEFGEVGGWQRERLFSALTEVLAGAARRSAVAVVIEDVHWADNATLDCLTFLLRTLRQASLTLVVTCRSDEMPLDALVAGWLEQARSSPLVEEIRLDPLSRSEVAEQIAALAGAPVPGVLADQVYARGEGNPFFTEQLASAALVGDVAAGLGAMPAGLPARLADLLLARAGRCGGRAWEVLAALAVASRPLTEAALASIAGLGPDAVRHGLRELAAASLLADPVGGEATRPRHALLAEAVAGALLPGERAVMHRRSAEALESAGDAMLAAEAAGHWAAAGRPERELPARVAAAQAAERVFGYDQAAEHLLRAIQLCLTLPDAASAGLDLAILYVRAIDALEITGDIEQAAAVAEEAYRRFADHPDHDTAAAIHLRMAEFRMSVQPADAFPLIGEAIRLAGQGPPSAVQAEAWYRYGSVFPATGAGDRESSQQALQRAVQIAEQASAAALIPQCLVSLADHALVRGEIDEALALLGKAQAGAEDCGDGRAIVWAAMIESFVLGLSGRTEASIEVALAGLRAARQLGRQDSREAGLLTGNAFAGLIERGRTVEAAELLDWLATGQPGRDNSDVLLCRAEIEILHGDFEAAQQHMQQVKAMTVDHVGMFAGEFYVQRLAAVLALSAGRPAEALDELVQVLPSLASPVLTFRCGPVLVAGMRACADLAEIARACQNEGGVAPVLAAADDLASWVDQAAGVPFADHPAMASIPADRATWDAERSRMACQATPWRGLRRQKPGTAWAGRTTPGTPGGGRRRRSWTLGSPPPPSPPRCVRQQPPPAATCL